MTALLAAAGDTAMAAAASGLPNGVGSLRETYGRWEVACLAQGPAPSCVMAQTLVDGATKQRMLTLEFRPAGGGGAKATLVMPFGLDLAKGVTLAQGNDAAGPSRPVSTCLPVGCIVPLTFDAAAVSGLRKATTLTIGAVANDSGKSVQFPVPLEGFSAAYARISALSN